MTLTDEEIRVKVAELMDYQRLIAGSVVENPPIGCEVVCGVCRAVLRKKQSYLWSEHESCGPMGGPCCGNNQWKLFSTVWTKNNEAQVPPDWLNDPAAALQLCDRMHSEGWNEDIFRTPGAGWKVVFSRLNYAERLEEFGLEDPSLARAVTLCFLAAHSNEN